MKVIASLTSESGIFRNDGLVGRWEMKHFIGIVLIAFLQRIHSRFYFILRFFGNNDILNCVLFSYLVTRCFTYVCIYVILLIFFC